MNKMMLLGAAALVGLAFAPSAAAGGGWSQFDGCQVNESPPPIGDQGVFALCLLSKYEEDWGSTSYTQSYPAYVFIYSQDTSTLSGYRIYTNAEGGVRQYVYESPWTTEEGSFVGYYGYHSVMEGWSTVAQAGAWAYISQYHSSGSWQYDQTYVSGGFQGYVEGEYNYAQVYYYQYDYGNGCTEAAYLSYSLGGDWGSEELLAPQPCTVEAEPIPQLM